MAVLKFNRIHKNGWVSYKTPGVAGAVFIDKRHVTAEFMANPPAELDLAIEGLLPPGANATEASAAKAAKKAEREAAKAVKAEAAKVKAEARVAKLQAQAEKAAARAAAATAKSGGAAPASNEATQ